MSKLKNTEDVFENDEQHQIHYKTLSWQFAALLMITEIVGNGILSLPNTLAVVGIVPGLILTAFFGVFALYTAKLLIDFKLNHPNVHSMGDAGYIMFGPIGREILLFGTVAFAICIAGSQFLTGQQALTVLTDGKICTMYYVLICAAATLLIALPRTLDQLGWMGFVSAGGITIAAVLSMIGSGVNPVPGRVLSATISTSFENAFLSITNPVFGYAGHFMFFVLLSEMKRPQDAMKAAWCLQGFATTLFLVYSIVNYAYIGNTIQSPNFFSLPPRWAKACFGISLFTYLFSGGICLHTVAKVLFVRFFRHSAHTNSHTLLGWTVWFGLCFVGVAAGVVLAIAVPIFSYLVGIVASLFAAWYTYGLAGMFWLHDTYHLKGGIGALKRRPMGTALAVLTLISGGFICITGTYVFVKEINLSVLRYGRDWTAIRLLKSNRSMAMW